MEDINTRLRLLREKINKLLMLNANGYKQLVTNEDIQQTLTDIKELKYRIHIEKLKQPINKLIQG